MASYHCSVKVGGKGKAAAHAAYIAREGKYSAKEAGKESGRARYEDLEACAYGNMPAWAAHNPAHFWRAADEHERANGATYREIELALPRELTPAQRYALVHDLIGQEIGERHAYQWAIHTPKAALEKGEQPHAHIMYSERTVDGLERDPEQYFKRYNAKHPEKGGCRKDSAGTEERLQATRRRWADVQNRHLARHGHASRVDHRRLKEQGIEREPEQHLGPIGVRQLRAHDISALLERRAAEGERERAQQQVSGLIDLSGDLKAAKVERDLKAAQQAAQQAALELKETAAAGVAAFRARFELAQKVEQGKREAREAFQRWKAEQDAKEKEKQEQQAREKEKERQAELARQKEAAERQRQEAKRQAKIEQKEPKQEPKQERDRDGPDGPGWSR